VELVNRRGFCRLAARLRPAWRVGIGLLLAAAGSSGLAAAAGEVRTLLVLHTNDIHDHIRAGYEGRGGLPFIAGFIQDVRSRRSDVLVLDAGDVAEKGDLLARRTGSEIVFEAMGRAGYHAWAPGNHDHDFGLDALRRFAALSRADLLCINLIDARGRPLFQPSAIYVIGGLRVGVIGAIVPRAEGSLDLAGTAAAIRDEARRLVPATDVIIVVMHLGSREALRFAAEAVEVDVFVTGHTHELLPEPLRAPGNGAFIVQAGSYANYVGWLELRVDPGPRAIVGHDYRLVPMDHHVVRPDLAMLEWLRQEEDRLAPEARQIVGWTPEVVDYAAIGCLAAEALRRATGADIGLNHTAHIVRSRLPRGILDYNAVYRTGGERGTPLIEVELSGRDLETYQSALAARGDYPTQWSGFHGHFQGGQFASDLEPERRYRVVMPAREWDRRFRPAIERFTPSSPVLDAQPVELALTWTDAVVHLLGEWNAASLPLAEGIARVMAETGQEAVLKALR
jgi:2',3'-cyclic-nucleotide 2'-phosphodiesterase (5'-nucleotidase family)